MKKGYLIKETQINLKNGELQIFYIGKNGFVRKTPNTCEKWSKRCYAYNKLQKDCINYDGKIGYEYMDLFNYFSNNKVWFNHIDILEVKYE